MDTVTHMHIQTHTHTQTHVYKHTHAHKLTTVSDKHIYFSIFFKYLIITRINKILRTKNSKSQYVCKCVNLRQDDDDDDENTTHESNKNKN